MQRNEIILTTYKLDFFISVSVGCNWTVVCIRHSCRFVIWIEIFHRIFGLLCQMFSFTTSHVTRRNALPVICWFTHLQGIDAKYLDCPTYPLWFDMPGDDECSEDADCSPGMKCCEWGSHLECQSGVDIRRKPCELMIKHSSEGTDYF